MINKAKSLIAARRQAKRVEKQAEKRAALGFPEVMTTKSVAQSYKPRFKYSVITAAYGVADYVDEFFSSLMQQTVGFVESIEVIVVDDGSVDETLIKCKVWQERYPASIKVISQENAGPAEARNAGLPFASNDWITFTDPDDILANDYFENVDLGICRNLDAGFSVDVVACNLIMYREESGALVSNHALNASYSRGEKLVSFNEDMHDDIKLSAASCFFRRASIVEKSIIFPDVRPSFEDALFIACYLLESREANVLFLPKSIYFYRKRISQNSLVDTAWGRDERYSEQLEFAYLPLLEKSLKERGVVPRWVQRAVFYDLSWHFKMFFNNHKSWSLLPAHLNERYFILLEEILKHIDVETILGFELAGVPEHLKMGIISRFKDQQLVSENIRLVKSDFKKRETLIGFYHTQVDPTVELAASGKRIDPFAKTVRKFDYFGEPIVYETLRWVRWQGDSLLSVKLNQSAVPFQIGRRRIDSLAWADVKQRFAHPALDTAKMLWEKRAIRRLSRAKPISRRYHNAWLLMDRDTQADDNAEHLYRYLMHSHPEVNAWFVLRKGSHDWSRLEHEGFRLLDFGGVQHKLAMLNAGHLISSHADHYLFSILPPRYYRDLLKYRFTFLQHGVIQNDLSSWLNSKNIDCFVTSAISEYQSIALSGRYKYTEKEVALTGLPRHDRLLSLDKTKESAPGRKVVIMPTWRQGLAGEVLGETNNRKYNASFKESGFFKAWQAVLTSPKVRLLADKHNFELVFFPHANLHQYIKDFSLEGVSVLSHGQTGIQDVLVSADLLITDYSSVAFETAILNRSIIYYQFDRDFVFNGGHTTRKGYFDYDLDGFGPVALTLEALEKTLEQVVENDFVPEPEYLERMEAFFPFRDGKSCQRVVERIKALDSPEPSVIDVLPQ